MQHITDQRKKIEAYPQIRKGKLKRQIFQYLWSPKVNSTLTVTSKETLEKFKPNQANPFESKTDK